jgi:IMP cyclohydrolase
MSELSSALAGNRYPGRGVLWCRTTDGEPLGGYFLTGRSQASKARTLHVRDDQLIVAPSDLREHDSLRHYVAARQAGDWVVFGNGEQVDTVAARLDASEPPALALDGLDYEPDAPIFTPRLTVVADGKPGGQVWFGAARHSGAERGASDRLTLQVSDLQPGEGVLVTTYLSDGNEIATGAPFTEVRVAARDRSELLEQLWSSLAVELRVAAAVFSAGRLTEALIRQQPADQ